jgi:hypothetical protein
LFLRKGRDWIIGTAHYCLAIRYFVILAAV